MKKQSGPLPLETRVPCNAQDVTVWLDGSGAANAT